MNGHDWDGEERRRRVRRQSDRDVCPFHKIKCDAIQSNKNNIHEIEKTMVTKQELNILWDDVKTRAPRWVMILLVGLTAGIVAWSVIRTDNKFEQIYVLRANQEILMKAFSIKPVANAKEAEEKLEETASKQMKGGERNVP